MNDISFFVIEDHSLTNLGIRQFFASKGGYICSGFASEKKEALEKLEELASKNELPLIMFLDLNLGRDSGLEILDIIQKKYKEIKVIVYSMYTNPGIISLALEYGAQGFVSKDSMEGELVHAVQEVVAGGSYVQNNLITSLFTYKNLLDIVLPVRNKIYSKKLLKEKIMKLFLLN